MKLVTLFFILNAILLILHEIESAYEEEWNILKLPVRITGFILLHIPILLLLFYGVIEIEKNSIVGLVLGIISGIGGLVPFIVHKLLVNQKAHFNLPISNILIYLNIATGIITTGLSIYLINI